VVLAENQLSRAEVEEELTYWRGLARAQERLIRRANSRAMDWSTVSPEEIPISSALPVPPSAPAWNLDNLHEWAAAHSETIVILPRAAAAARKSRYQDHGTVFAALEILAGTYRDVKMGRAPREQAQTELEALGIAMGGSVEPTRAGERGDEYFVRWRGQRRMLDQHLKKGVSRDPRFCLRVYFTWDDDLKKCVVGWLPSHLSCSNS